MRKNVILSKEICHKCGSPMIACTECVHYGDSIRKVLCHKCGSKAIECDCTYDDDMGQDFFKELDPELQVTGMSFGQALEALKRGYAVGREGWNGRGMSIYLVKGADVDRNNLRNEAAEHLGGYKSCDGDIDKVAIRSHIDMKTSTNSIAVGWSASQSDMLSEDWLIVKL